MKQHLKGIVVHLAVMGLLIFAGFYYLFYVYLPVTTKHGETRTVPNLVELPLSEVAEKLDQTTLQYVVIDSSTYNPRFEPMVVMSQVPTAETLVKENRKIYITVNARNVPNVALPRLKDRYLRDALITLEANGFVKDSVIYKPSSSPLVLGFYHKGKPVEEGEKLPRGSRITLVVGIQEGAMDIAIPDLIGRNYKGLKQYVEEQGLLLSEKWVENPDYSQGHVFWQEPAPSDTTATKVATIRIGSIIDVKIAGKKPQEEETTPQP